MKIILVTGATDGIGLASVTKARGSRAISIATFCLPFCRY